LALGRPARREADAAIAHDRGGDAMRRGWRDAAAPGRLPIVVRVNVDEARGDELAFGGDLLVTARGPPADLEDAAVLDRDIGFPRRVAEAIDHGARADDQPALAHRFLHSHSGA